MDYFGSNTLNDRFFANDPGTHGLAKSRAKERLAWRLELIVMLGRISFHAEAWRAVIDAIADDTPMRRGAGAADGDLRDAA
jgi:hypothetical protein